MKNVAILLFDDVEVLDFAGPFEIFSVTNELGSYRLMNIYTVAEEKRPIIARNGLSVNPDYAIVEAPHPDILILPGGNGTRPLLRQAHIIQWISDCARNAEKLLSVCSGALLLAQAGLLKGFRATTHHQVFETLEKLASETQIVRDQRFVDNGPIITSAGISAGIDMSLHVIGLLYGRETAEKSAAYMEYNFAEPVQTEFS